MCEVVINLKHGDRLTAEDVRDGTVHVVGEATTSGTIDGATGIMAQAGATGSKEIIPHVRAAPPDGYQKSVQAIVVPQQATMNTKFIKVPLGEGTAARE